MLTTTSPTNVNETIITGEPTTRAGPPFCRVNTTLYLHSYTTPTIISACGHLAVGEWGYHLWRKNFLEVFSGDSIIYGPPIHRIFPISRATDCDCTSYLISRPITVKIYTESSQNIICKSNILTITKTVFKFTRFGQTYPRIFEFPRVDGAYHLVFYFSMTCPDIRC